jgi:Primase C terminal 1 (PriCT-1)
LLQVWNEARCRPPLPPEDIERIVDSIASKELMRRAGNAG